MNWPPKPGLPQFGSGDDDTEPTGEPQPTDTRKKVKTAVGVLGLSLPVVAFWYLYSAYLGVDATVASLVGLAFGVALLPLLAIMLPLGNVSKLFDWLGAATIGAWGLYLNSRERQEFVAVDDEKGLAYTSDGDVHFDVEQSTEYQAGKRPFFLLHYLDSGNAANTYRDGVDEQPNPVASDGGIRVFDRMTMDGAIQLATQYAPDTDEHLVDRREFLSRFENATGGRVADAAKELIMKEEGGRGGTGNLSKWRLLQMLAGAGTALVASLLVG